MRVLRNAITQDEINTILLHYKDSGSNSHIDLNHGYDIDKLIDYSSIFYCNIDNPYIRNIVDKVIGVNDTIYSIHMIRYTQGNKCERHLDRSSNQTYIFMLSEEFSGGDLLIDGVNSNITKGDVVCFNGQKEQHEVTEITDGIRDVLVVWTEYSIKEKQLI